jgi:hypothetical protein
MTAENISKTKLNCVVEHGNRQWTVFTNLVEYNEGGMTVWFGNFDFCGLSEADQGLLATPVVVAARFEDGRKGRACLNKFKACVGSMFWVQFVGVTALST